ncbi:MAG: hypothetical protein RLP14_06665 [Owenweeksia sp.]
MEPPKLPTIFKQGNARNFNYQPLYYDEEKERRNELKRKYAGEPEKLTREDFRSQLRQDWQKTRGKQVGSSNVRLVIIAIALFLITYLIIAS